MTSTEGGKHTPGPWEVCGQFVRTPFRHGEPDAAGLMVADVGFGIWPPEQHAANARLIAAVPALLEATYPETLEAIANEIDSFEHSARAASLRGIAKRQRAAILQATGGEDVG